MRVFWQHGFDGTSIAMLQAATGLTAPSLYNAFGSKAGLYGTCLDRYTERTAADVNEVLLEDPVTRSGLEAFLAAAARQFTDPDQPRGCMVSTAALELAPAHSAIVGDAAQRRTIAMTMIADYVRRAQAAKVIEPTIEADVLARVVGSLLQGMSVQARDGATLDDLLATVRLAARAWKPGSAADQPPP